ARAVDKNPPCGVGVVRKIFVPPPRGITGAAVIIEAATACGRGVGKYDEARACAAGSPDVGEPGQTPRGRAVGKYYSSAAAPNSIIHKILCVHGVIRDPRAANGQKYRGIQIDAKGVRLQSGKCDSCD